MSRAWEDVLLVAVLAVVVAAFGLVVWRVADPVSDGLMTPATAPGVEPVIYEEGAGDD